MTNNGFLTNDKSFNIAVTDYKHFDDAMTDDKCFNDAVIDNKHFDDVVTDDICFDDALTNGFLHNSI